MWLFSRGSFQFLYSVCWEKDEAKQSQTTIELLLLQRSLLFGFLGGRGAVGGVRVGERCVVRGVLFVASHRFVHCLAHACCCTCRRSGIATRPNTPPTAMRTSTPAHNTRYSLFLRLCVHFSPAFGARTIVFVRLEQHFAGLVVQRRLWIRHNQQAFNRLHRLLLKQKHTHT